MKLLRTLLLVFLCISADASSLFGLDYNSFSYFSNDSIDGGLAANFNRSLSKHIDFTFNSTWSWYDKLYVDDFLYGTGYDRVEEFGLGGTIVAFYRYNSYFTPFISIGFLQNWESDIFSELLLDWNLESEGVVESSIGVELNLSKVIGRVTHSNYDAGYSAQRIDIHYWYKDNRALGFSTSKYSSDFNHLDMFSVNWIFISN